ncbi:MAG: hypothetical protein IIB39_06410 [Candidatus Marinimicrobia bacterium]|nr:hypothetical protein [Candidatus Neomarinimicrobiota bacterium]
MIIFFRLIWRKIVWVKATAVGGTYAYLDHILFSPLEGSVRQLTDEPARLTSGGGCYRLVPMNIE